MKYEEKFCVCMAHVDMNGMILGSNDQRTRNWNILKLIAMVAWSGSVTRGLGPTDPFFDGSRL